jgi:hypothetical protein
MHIHFALEPIPKSIFLAGPTPRDPLTPTWRREALRILEHDLQFDGTVLVPEKRDWGMHKDRDGQIHWEWEALNQATVVAFWVPRNLASLPAFTTNVEFGLLAASGKCLLGFPPGAPKMPYLAALAARHHMPVYTELAPLLAAAVDKANSSFGGDFDIGSLYARTDQ